MGRENIDNVDGLEQHFIPLLTSEDGAHIRAVLGRTHATVSTRQV